MAETSTVMTNSTTPVSSLFFDVRSLFYLLTPRETYYEKVDDVPDLTLNAANLFFVFIVIEQVISLLKNGRFSGRFNDSVRSIISFSILLMISKPE